MVRRPRRQSCVPRHDDTLWLMISGSAQIHIAMLLTEGSECAAIWCFLLLACRDQLIPLRQPRSRLPTPMAHSCFRCHEHQMLRPNLTVCETDHLCPSSSECDTAALLDLLAASEGIMLALCDAQCLRPFLWKVVKQTKCYHHGHPHSETHGAWPTRGAAANAVATLFSFLQKR